MLFRRMLPTKMEESITPMDGRLFTVAVNDDLSINLLPFILFVKFAFILGKDGLKNFTKIHSKFVRKPCKIF